MTTEKPAREFIEFLDVSKPNLPQPESGSMEFFKPNCFLQKLGGIGSRESKLTVGEAVDIGNAILQERGTVVYAHSEEEQRKWDCYDWKPYPNFLGVSRQALLINIQPIVKPDTAESLLFEALRTMNPVHWTGLDQDWIERAKKLLGQKT